MKSILFFFSFNIINASIVYGADNVDDILDRLERKLLVSKQESLLLNENWNKSISKPQQKKIVLDDKAITGFLPSEKDMNDIGLAIEKLESEAEMLSADIEKMKRVVVTESQADSFVNIYIEVIDSNSMSLRELEISLDQFPIYKLSPDVGIWLPRKKIPIFSGPLNPGQHKISLKARVAGVEKESVPIDTGVYHIFNQEFKIDIPQKRIRKEYGIQLQKIKNTNLKAKATFVDKTM